MREFFNFEEASNSRCREEAAGNGNVCFDMLSIADDMIPESFSDIYSGKPLDNFEDFEAWIPTTFVPAHPCDYCRDTYLHCLLISKEQASCSSCTSLHRECSFTRDSMAQENDVADDEPLDIPLRQQQQQQQQLQPRSNAGQSENNGRFSRDAVKKLKDWYSAHSYNPYPSLAEKETLKRETGLKRSQISNWLANARRRAKAPPKSATATLPIAIPMSDPSFGQMDPLERWKNSPPENEAADVSDIANAIAASALAGAKDSRSSSSGASLAGAHRSSSSSVGSNLSMFNAPSLSSLETSQSSEKSHGSAYSHRSRPSFERRRRRRKVSPKIGEDESSSMKKPYQCTFCTDRFKTKYDWQRHEKSLHLSLERWTCAPFGGSLHPASNPTPASCAYCLAPNPTPEHLEAAHHHSACAAKPLAERTFFRKDHFTQHLRLTHSTPFAAHMAQWKVAHLAFPSRCGFCAQAFTHWDARREHVAAHFRAGKRMAEWKGDWGFDAGVEAIVENAVPPWLNDVERRSANPFSATRDYVLPLGGEEVSAARGVQVPAGELDAGVVGREGWCFKRLEVALARWVTEERERGNARPDEGSLQRQARCILYTDPDPWEQTAADDPEWLGRFKRKYGLV
ncbi:MAG: hypothetical protein M1829_002221 [Trizodia sp. TS-e1964]|nr:MAG: hypothetical protein M1829_002221 [Trizodia sp. TS-e1964]